MLDARWWCQDSNSREPELKIVKTSNMIDLDNGSQSELEVDKNQNQMLVDSLILEHY